ncbi:MAG: hypothetical protein PHS86_07815 [Syntrophaceae bacterium]|nr:hypothetical protein [Syntrophaceae bacterium]
MGHVNLFRPLIEATLAEDIKISKGRLHLIRCKLFDKDGELMAVTTGTQSSGALRSMVLADGLIMLPPEKAPFKAGDRVKIQSLHTNSPLSPDSHY